MQTTYTPVRIHPLIAGAAASVMLVSLVGVAAMTGLLPDSRSENQVAQAQPIIEKTVAAAPEEAKPAPKRVVQKAPAKPAYVQEARAPRYVQTAAYDRPQPTYQQPVYQQPVQQPTYQQPQASPQLSPVGIAAGAVLGGVLGNQVGGGNGKKLATIAGVIGGGYLGNEVAKRYGY